MLQSTFLTLFLTQVKGLAPTTAGWVIRMSGWARLIGGISLPLLSDTIGRKPVLLAVAVLLSWLPLGIARLYCAAVPPRASAPP